MTAKTRTLIPLEESPDAEESSEAKESYVWSFPGAPIKVNLRLEVVAGIRQSLEQVSADGRSAQLRGLLLGNLIRPGIPEVTAFRLLSTAGTDELEAAITFFKNSGDNLLPVGYFRTHPDGRLALSPDDLRVAQTYFFDPSNVFLLIQTSDAAALSAGFFYWDRGKMNGGFHDFCFLEFPFDVSLLPATKPSDTRTDPAVSDNPKLLAPSRLAEPMPASAPPPQPEIISAPQLPPASPPETRGEATTAKPPGRFWRTALLTFSAVLLGVAGFVGGILLTHKLVSNMDQRGNAESTGIDLKIQHQSSELSVTWNHNSPLVAHAQSGLLKIDDGGERQFPLDQSHLRSGSVVYSPVSDQIRVQLDLTTPDQRIVSESVMVILNKPATTSSSPVIPPAKVQSSLFSPAREKSVTRSADALPDRTPAEVRKEFHPPPTPSKPPSGSPEPAPPPAVGALTSAPTIVLPQALPSPRNQPPSAPSPTPAPSADVAVGPVPRPSTRPSERLSDIVPAVPIRQAVPPLTSAQRDFVRRTVLVDIKVLIDESGRVQRTEPLTQAPPVLVAAAQSAAKLWIFRPAQRGGQNVASEMILKFKFDPPR